MTGKNPPNPYTLEGGDVGVLLVHGYSGAPNELGYLAHSLHAAGYTVSVPLLPGHGATPEAMRRVSFSDWQQTVDQAFDELHRRCRATFIGGLSMGGVLSLSYAERAARLSLPAPAGVISMAAPMYIDDWRSHLVPLLKYVIRWTGKGNTLAEKVSINDKAMLDEIWAYLRTPSHAAHQILKLIAQTRRQLREVVQPTLIIQSRTDPTAPPPSAEIIYDGISSFSKELLWLDNSSHIVTLDFDRDLVSRRVLSFMARHTPAADALYPARQLVETR